MNVREQLTLLSQLGLIDLRLKELREKHKVLPLKANEAKSRSTGASLEQDGFKSQTDNLESQKKQLEIEIQTEKGNLRKWEARAEKIKGEREYTTLLSEIGSQKKAISNLETRMLELLEQQGKLNAQLAKVKDKLDLANAEFDDEWDKISDDLKSLEASLAESLSGKAEVLKHMPAPLLKRYEQIASKRAGTGITFLEKGVCKACRRSLPPELCNRILKGEIVESCPSCNRLLVAESIGA
ncbi:MAG: hypothetical protein V4534_01005 [Myxococcota bacterium]